MTLIRISWPPQPLWPNRSHGKSWKASQDAKKAQKTEAWAAAIAQSGSLKGNPSRGIAITFHKTDRRRYDLQNAYSALKIAQDEICKVWGIDDSEITRVTLVRGEPVKGGCVLIEIGEGVYPLEASSYTDGSVRSAV